MNAKFNLIINTIIVLATLTLAMPAALADTLDLQTAAEGDDAHEYGDDGSVTTGDDQLKIYSDTSATSANYRYGGMRWQNVTIPQGATITAAYISVYSNGSDNEDNMNVDIHFEVADNPLEISDTNTISTRTRTTASVSWVGELALAIGSWHDSPSLVDVIQEVVDGTGWNSGDALMAILVPHTDSYQKYRCATADNSDPLLAPKLHIEYSLGGCNVRVKETNDDMYYRTTTLYYDTTRLLWDESTVMVRFQDVCVPQGATISNAYIEFAATPNGGSNAVLEPTVSIEIEDTTNSPPVTDSFTGTGTTISWSQGKDWDTDYEKHQTPDISTLIQQIVSQAGWAENNAMTFKIDHPTSPEHEAMSYEQAVAIGNSDLIPLLHIEFSGGEEPPPEGGADPAVIIHTDKTEIGALCYQNTSPPLDSFVLSNIGSNALNYSISANAAWVTLEPALVTSGTLAGGEETTLEVRINAAGLAVGDHEAIITISDANAGNSPYQIQVSLTVDELPEAATCGYVPVYMDNLVNPAILILLDVSSSMGKDVPLSDVPLPQTPELKTIVQEIVNRGGWESGNGMAFILDEPSGLREAVSYNNNSAKAPLLHVEYDGGTVFERLIEVGSHDAEEYLIGGVTTSSTVLDIGDTIVGLLFRNVNIPFEANIEKAYIEFNMAASSSGPTAVTIYGEAINNPTQFDDVIADDISGRTQTAAAVPWILLPWSDATEQPRIEVGKTVISELVQDRSIAWGYGTWSSADENGYTADVDYTLIHEGCKPNSDTHQAALQDAISNTEKQSGTPFTWSIVAARKYFTGLKKDKEGTGNLFAPLDCQPRFLINITDGQGNTGSSVENVNTNTTALLDAGVSGIGIGFDLPVSSAEQLYEFAKVANARGKLDPEDGLFALHEETGDPAVAQPFFAYNRDDLFNSLTEITESIKGSIFYGSAPAPTTSVELGDSVVIAKFDASHWLGDLTTTLMGADGSWTDVVWTASEEMPANRSLWTTDTDGVVWEVNVKNYPQADSSKHFSAGERIKGQLSNTEATVVGTLFTGIDTATLTLNEIAGAFTSGEQVKGMVNPDHQADFVGSPVAKDIDLVDNLSVVPYTSATLAGDNFTCFESVKPIGDIINSVPVVVGYPPYFYPFDDYARFASETVRDSMIYVGANDGALHAFRLEDGVEMWAFVPPSMHEKLNQATTDPLFDRCSLGYCHQTYVDGSPVVGDVYADFFGTSEKEWRTVLVVGERKGGEAYFALDVTSGEDFEMGNADPATFLWEFTDGDRLGQTWADPSIDLVTTDSVMPAWCWWCNEANDPTWGMFFGSGYASTAIAQTTKEAYLYGLTVQDAGPLWKDAAGDPTNRIKLADGNKLDYEDEEDPFSVGEVITGDFSGATATVVAVTPSGDTGTLTLTNVSGTFQHSEVLIGGSGGEAEANGTLYGGLANNALGAVLMVDLEGDYISDRIYVGDLYGNMYRVTDIGKNQTPQVSTLFTYNNNSPNINPIRARASFAYGKTPGDIWLYFGSGRFEEGTDKLNNQLQYFFGLRDGATPRTPAYETDELITLRPFFASIDVDGEAEMVRIVDGTNPTAASWKMELYNGQAAYSGPAIVGSERVVTQPLVVGGIVFFSTFIPDADVCDGGGDTWVFALDYDTGMAATEPVFDINGDGLFDVNDMVEDGGETKVPVAINVGRGQGSHPVLHKKYLFVTTSGDGGGGGGGGGGPPPPPPPPPPPINLPDYRVVLDSWRQN